MLYSAVSDAEKETATVIPSTGDFPLEQSRDDILHSALDQVMKIDGDTRTEEENTQLLVLRIYREITFQVAFPMVHALP